MADTSALVLLRQIALMLRLPVSTVSTALHFLHNFQRSAPAAAALGLLKVGRGSLRSSRWP